MRTPRLEILQGDALTMLKTLASDSVHCVVTSPGYWGLRSYLPVGHPDKSLEHGTEETLDAYLDRLVAVFEEVRRVLHPSGVVFVDIGDSYAGGGRGGNPDDSPFRKQATNVGSLVAPSHSELPPKNRCLVPFRLALRLQASGWWVRDVIAWCLSGGAWIYARTQKGDMPIMVRDVVRLDPATVQLWNGVKWTRVIGWGPSTDESEKLELVLRSGERIGCTGGHLWPTQRGNVTARDLRIGDTLKACLLPQPVKPERPASVTFSALWLVGLYLAEGNRSGGSGRTVNLGVDELPWLARIEDVANFYGGSCSHNLNGNILTVRLYGRMLHALLDTYIGGSVAVDKHLKNAAWQLPNDALRQIAQGYLDGDAHSDTFNNRWRLGFCRNYYLERDLRTLAARLGATLTLRPATSKAGDKEYPAFRGEWRWERSGDHAEKDRNEILEIRASRARHFWDIAVEDEPHLFALASGVLTHNCKPAPMPESVTDRCTQAWEPILMLTKSAHYFWDAEAIKEPQAQGTFDRFGNGNAARKTTTKAINCIEGEVRSNASFKDATPEAIIGGRNARNVWSIGPEPFTDSVPGPDGKPVSHFAAFPSALPRKCILAATSAKGVCPECGEPWVREVERERGIAKECPSTVESHLARGGSGVPIGTVGKAGSSRIEGTTRTLGWRVGCDCNAGNAVPATVFDPFLGTGTTCAVALELGRNAIGIELNPVYCELAMRRFVAVTPGLQLA